MRANEKASILSEGDALLRRLFNVAMNRLRERGISMWYTPSVIDWMLGQSDWQASLNPLRTLDGWWHQRVAFVIEELLLEERLREGNTLFISTGETSIGPQLQFEIDTPIPEQ